MSFNTGFVHGFAIALDYCLDLLLFWRRAIPMTVSSQAGLALLRGERTTALALLGRALNTISPGHTDAAIEADKMRLDNALLELEHPQESH